MTEWLDIDTRCNRPMIVFVRGHNAAPGLKRDDSDRCTSDQECRGVTIPFERASIIQSIVKMLVQSSVIITLIQSTCWKCSMG